MNVLRTTNRQRGEVASFLTIVSMVVLSLGLFVGYRLNSSTATINPAPQAAGPAISQAIPADGVDRHDQVCFPGGDKNQQVRDKFCRTRMYPSTLLRDTIKRADSRAKRLFEAIYSGTEQSKPNPATTVITEKDQRTVRLYGGLCLNRSSLEDTKLQTSDVEVYVSLFGVRKFYDSKNQVGIEERDINEVLRYKIAAAEDKLGSDSDDTLFPAQARRDICTFTNGAVDATDYRSTDNPLLFSIQMAKASIESAIERAKKDSTIQQKFDTKECSVYIHLRDNIAAGAAQGSTGSKPKDTYNIYKVDLRDVLGKEAETICPPVTATPTPPVSTSLPSTLNTQQVTVTVTPPLGARCFEKCTPSTVCAKDPSTKGPLLCYNADGLGGLKPFPTTVDAREDGSLEPNTENLTLCAPGDNNCLCLPTKCQFNPALCKTKLDACPQSVTPTITISVTPPTTITVTPPTDTPTNPPPSITTYPEACTFDAVAYVQECTTFDQNGQCKRGTDGRFIARSIDVGNLGLAWGASNNKQIAGGRYGSEPATPFKYLQNTFVGALDSLKARFPYLASIGINELTFIDHKAEVPLQPGKNPLEPGSAADLTPEGRAKNPILIDPFNQHPSEQYFNRETAQVRLYADFANNGYRIVPEGNEIQSCINTLTGTPLGACDLASFQANRVNETLRPGTPDSVGRDPRDTIDGLTVGCGQNIVYGWTLQKCNNEPADYVFVIDVSTSMSTGKDLSGDLKIDAAKKSINAFLTTISTFSKDSRAALVQFSSKDNTRIVEGLTSNIAQVQNALSTKLTVKAGTCIEEGLGQTISLLQGMQSNRKTYVVFLTDGLPNCPDRAPQSDSIKIIEAHGNTLRSMSNLKTYAIGVGNPNLEGVGADVELFEVIKLIASTPETAFSASGDVSINDIYANIQTELNSCARSEALYANYISSQDINGDGVINTIDLFLVYDNYFQKGQDLPEDLNGDKVVNSLDVSIIVNNMGKIIPQENNTAQKSLGDVFN
ncbi:MAG: von Willebrand factor type A domain protein [Microgenomates bacterium OLB23]|nr:MAG: von Willebrand factor type A domain protein [Microgenomates bacterium OLB23]